MEIKNKNVIITGAAQGIGKALSFIFAEKGANLILVDIDSEGLIELEKELLKLYNDEISVKIFSVDLTNSKGIENFAETINKSQSQIDTLINNAGIGIYKNLEDLEIYEWQNAINLNVTAPFLLTKMLLPNLLQKDSKNINEKSFIINIGSGCGIEGVSGRTSYCTTKFGLRGLSLSLAKELKGQIKVIYLALGSVLTEFGPLNLKEKGELARQHKNYLSVEQVAKKIIELIEKNYKKAEYKFYPKGYLKQLKNIK